MIAKIVNLKRSYTVAIITLIAIVVSSLLTLVGILLFDPAGFSFNLAFWISILLPMLIAPAISWPLIGLLLETYQTEQKMRELASHDTLTGLLTRHAFFESALSYVTLAKREKSAFSIAIVDLDLFKKINDRYGHPTGDAVLQLFASVLYSVSRRSDIIGRVGGEEFALLLPSTQQAEAYEFCQRLHGAIGKAVLKHDHGLISYTASIGLASFDSNSQDSVENMLALADKALYKAKNNGRNQTAIYSDQNEKITA